MSEDRPDPSAAAAPSPAATPPPVATATASRRHDGALIAYAGTAVLSIAVAVGMLNLWQADLRVPFVYGGDATVHAMTVKATGENGWYLTIPQLGAPGQLQLQDFPCADTLHLLVIKVLQIFVSNWAVVFNVYYLLGFPLIALAALAVFRHFRVPLVPAVAGAILYAFLPSRLLKGETHLYLDVFFQVPLVMLAALWACGEAPPLTRDRGPGRWPGVALADRRSILAVVFCVAAALGGLYYAFFAAWVMLAGGLWASVDRRTYRNAISGIALASVILLASAMNALPSLLYVLHHGKNAVVATRLPAEAEIFGLKIIQLLLPVAGHRVEVLRRFTAHYNASAPLVTAEGRTVALGVMAGIGFLTLLGAVVLRARADSPRGQLWRSLGVLNLAALLLGTIGGFGALFARLVTPEIRTYLRINVIIGFLALFALVLLIERLGRRRPGLTAALSMAVLTLGLFDQVPPGAIPNYAGTKVRYRADTRYVQGIEAALPAGAMVFQLPFVAFPESPAPARMSDYDPLRFYLHARALRWSYPTMRGRPGDVWMRNVSAHAPDRMAIELADMGFGGILVDRFGYADDGAALEASLAKTTEVAPRISGDGRMAFYSLEPYKARVLSPLSRDDRERRRELAMHPLLFHWAAGCYEPEAGPEGPFRWCQATAEIDVENSSRLPRTVSIAMTLVPAKSPCRITIDSDLLRERVELSDRALFERTLEVPPGVHSVRFRADGKSADAPRDPRTMIFRAENPTLLEIARP